MGRGGASLILLWFTGKSFAIPIPSSKVVDRARVCFDSGRSLEVGDKKGGAGREKQSLSSDADQAQNQIKTCMQTALGPSPWGAELINKIGPLGEED